MKNIILLNGITIFMALAPPAEKLTPYCPSFNLIGLEYMLIWWGSAVIIAGGMGVSMIYYK
jgi:predicted cobalt transporter CbtA